MPRVQVRQLRPDAVVPRYMSDDAAGMDLYAAIDAPVDLMPGQRHTFDTGLAFAIPRGFEGQIRPRSGLARTYGVTVVNSPGTLDSDYRGSLMIMLVNLGHERVTISSGERIAQLVIAPVVRAELEVVDELPATSRGSGGFGSTGR